ncbi:MAG: sensor domain-containing diguanylate cyclase [Firmicutes bacterium]|nr:sensor domain-containing diguanylate cyclase [Bacillota bacterium]
MPNSLLYFVGLLLTAVGWRLLVYFNGLHIYRLVYDLENSFETELDFAKLSKNILQKVMKQTKASAGIIYWLDEAQRKFKLKSLQGIPADQLNRITRFWINETGLIEQTLKNNSGILIDNNQVKYPREAGNSVSGHLFSGILAVPLNTRGKTVGILVLFKKDSPFKKRDLKLLNCFASRTAMQLDHSRLYQLAADTALENAKLYINLNKLYHKAILDGLTGLYNRHFLMQRLKEELKKTYRYKQSLSLIFTDIDLFKQVNDQFGHQAGDRLLAEFADLIKKSIREYDMACRFGGEEFIILLPQTDLESALSLAERLREKTAATLFNVNKTKIRITASFGISALQNTDDDLAANPSDHDLTIMVENLLAWADDALYRAKKSGRNKVVIFEKQ